MGHFLRPSFGTKALSLTDSEIFRLFGLYRASGHHKNLDTIGKQNYLEQGVETQLNFQFFEEFYHYIF